MLSEQEKEEFAKEINILHRRIDKVVTNQNKKINDLFDRMAKSKRLKRHDRMI